MSGTTKAEPVRRTSEIEEPSNLYIIHPLSTWIVPYCARAGITPNQVSVAGMVCGITAGFAYHWYRHPAACLLGFALMFAWHVLDGADGQLARLTNSFSEVGKIIDGICDYVTFTAIYVGLALSLSAVHGGWVWAVVALSGLCHAAQSAAYELQRQNYNFWGWGRKSGALADLSAPQSTGIAGWLHGLYTRAQLALGGGGGLDFYARLAECLARHPEDDAAIRASYRATFAKPVRRWSLLSSNTRTIGIFLFAVAGIPLGYFCAEILLLTALLAWLLADQRQRCVVFAATL